MRKYRHTFISAGFVVALIAGCSKTEEKEEDAYDTAIPVSLSTVATEVRTDVIATAGTIASLGEARLSFKIGGVIDKIFVKEGQQVQAGQVLAALNLTEIEAQVSQARLSYEKSERDLERVRNMLRDTAATLEQFQNASTGFDLSRQNLDIARFNREFARISSPVDGTVIRKIMNEGEMTAPGSPVLVVISSRKSDWVARVGVSDRDWARLKPGDKAEVQLDAYPGESFSGNVTFLSQVADPVTHLYEVEIKLTGNVPRMAAGLFAKVAISPSQSRSYKVIPVEALLEGQGKAGFVFIAENGKAKKVPVAIGYLEGDKVLLTGGLDSTDQVVSGGSAFLTDGAEINIVR